VKKLALLLLLAGCPEEMREVPDSGVPIDTGVKTILFEAEQVAGPSLVFGDALLAKDRLDVDLVAHGLDRVYGLAFRVEYDPEVLAFAAMERAPAFTHEQMFEVKEARPGLIVVAASAVGPAPGIALDGAAIARLSLMRKTSALTEIRIVRPFGLDEAGEELRYRAGGGAIVEK
jgi:hypothetical protein